MKFNYKTKTEMINLIEGQFSALEARNVLLGLVEKKISFHRERKLDTVKNGFLQGTHYEKERIEELQAEKVKIQHLFETANNDQLIEMHGQLIVQVGGIA